MKPGFEKNELILQADLHHGDLTFPLTYHKHAELYLITEGYADFCADHKRFILKKGDLCLVFPYVLHSMQKQTGIVEVILFDPQILQGFADVFQFKKVKNPCILSNRVPEIVPSLIRKVRENCTDFAISKEIANAYLIAAIGEILKLSKLVDVSFSSITTVQKVLVYCAAHYKKNITIEKIAFELCISKNHVSRIFNTIFQYTFRDYINHLRITNAKEQLIKTDSSIIDIMLECGYMNQSTFNRVFFKQCGMTPRAFRKLNKQQLVSSAF